MGVISFLRSVVLQLFLMAALVAIPMLWYDSEKSMLNLGLVFTSCGFLYVLLPWSFIPDWVPGIGKVDQGTATAILLAGVGICGLVFYGEMPVEREALDTVSPEQQTQ
ncbi:hypothetical protein CBR_g38901 [Chara braunii]|uniref:Uncharacterized protein n=1 Tax=Chara braunii TaxID=69332 RepID=A0A388LQS9_CHABU|nr:hypothetical protein CBR_g38901 [Chara braunii]|eukprot:GBG84619.1 hypothetical protein CBR_g38901 [Chara braunii]